ncbi:GntR family transcriptional regulator [Kitasatospora sp. A2-31]|uniref:GntR family transcriptional regulator n=1 Tax=Kitasatospora sp. A2-31 TaxID=2916414 RepID=UPI001EED57A5|nr:GntR family transcriptional regulator [Kitasatospora sp. A2-31]MCG6499353.1 GntR family transcriptional regulator [Kitasatospora sp. A2-31]MCG6500030.1 GntR family transcriptional regulator [Kitasatospora sp. A2-31]
MSRNRSSSGFDLHVEIAAARGRRSGLEATLREAIRSGRLLLGSRLPSTRTLAGELGFARGTVTAAYDQLAEEGYLTVRPASGTRVAEVPVGDPVPAAPVTAPASVCHDLRPGLPDLSAFPTRAWLQAARRVLVTAPARTFGAGDPQGHPACGPRSPTTSAGPGACSPPPNKS